MSQTAAAPEPQPLDQLESLEQRIVAVVELLHQARAGRQQAEQEAAEWRVKFAELEAKLQTSAQSVAAALATRDAELADLRQQVGAALAEREEVRRRLEKLLRQVDALSE